MREPIDSLSGFHSPFSWRKTYRSVFIIYFGKFFFDPFCNGSVFFLQSLRQKKIGEMREGKAGFFRQAAYFLRCFAAKNDLGFLCQQRESSSSE